MASLLSTRIKVAIAIPTYGRTDEFFLALRSICSAYTALGNNPKLDLKVFVSYNLHPATSLKHSYADSLFHDRHIGYYHSINQSNIGGDLNILSACYGASRYGRYVWVLGDDDILTSSALDSICQEINECINEPLLLVLRCTNTKQKSRHRSITHASYDQYLLSLIATAGHPLENTLISKNIIRSDSLPPVMKVLDIYHKALNLYGLEYYFIMSIVFLLASLRLQDSSVVLINKPALILGQNPSNANLHMLSSVHSLYRAYSQYICDHLSYPYSKITLPNKYIQIVSALLRSAILHIKRYSVFFRMRIIKLLSIF